MKKKKKKKKLPKCNWVVSIDIHGKSQTSYIATCNGVISHGLKLGVFWFLPTTHAKTNAMQMCPWSLRAVQPFTCVYPNAKTTCRWHTWWTTVILIMGKTRRPQFKPHAGIKNGAGSGISVLCISTQPNSWLWSWACDKTCLCTLSRPITTKYLQAFYLHRNFQVGTTQELWPLRNSVGTPECTLRHVVGFY